MKDSIDTNGIVIGRNTVREALKSERSVDAVYVASGAQDGSIRELLALAKKNGVPVKQVPRSKLDEMAMPMGFNGRTGNHQGIAAQVSPVKYAELDDVFAKAESEGRPPFIIALDGISDNQNLGAIVRSAEVFGAHGVIIPRRRSASMTAAACKAACGAEEYIPIVKVTNMASTIDVLIERGVWVASADMGGVPAQKCNLSGALCLVIGAEGEGVSRLVRERSDFVVSIEMKGKIESLNASAAAAVLMYEKTRQDS